MGRWLAGQACSGVYANLDMHRVKDLKRLTCFHSFWKLAIWWFHFVVVHKDHDLFL